MAGAIIVACPLLLGLTVGGPALQVGMRNYGLDLRSRVGVELSMMGAGFLLTWLFPPRRLSLALSGSAQKGENWCTLIVALSIAASGAFGMVQGAIYDTVATPHTLAWAGAFLAGLCAMRWGKSGRQLHVYGPVPAGSGLQPAQLV